MPRRDSSFFQVLTFLPWWVSATLAVVTFIALYWVFPGVQTSNPLLQGVATGLPNLAPLLTMFFGLAALLSAFGSWYRRRLLDSQAEIDDVRKLSWQDFERLVGEAYRRQGHSVIERGVGGADGGVDLELRKGSERILVQCKHWKSWKVGVTPLREFFGVVVAENASSGIFVASGEYSRDAVDFALSNGIALVNGQALVEQIRSVQNRQRVGQGSPSFGVALSFIVPLAIVLGSVGLLFSGTKLPGATSPALAVPVPSVVPPHQAPMAPSTPRPDRNRLVWEAGQLFQAEYVAPEGCDSWASDREMVACTNHLMRARRDFLRRHPEFEGVHDWEL